MLGSSIRSRLSWLAEWNSALTRRIGMETAGGFYARIRPLPLNGRFAPGSQPLSLGPGLRILRSERLQPEPRSWASSSGKSTPMGS